MKKILISLMLLIAFIGFSEELYFDYTPSSITAVGTATNSFTYTVSGKRRAQIVGLYQDITTQTNTVVITVKRSGQSNSFTYDTLNAVTNTQNYQYITNDLWLNTGDIVTSTGTGADSTNVEYVLSLKQVTQ